MIRTTLRRTVVLTSEASYQVCGTSGSIRYASSSQSNPPPPPKPAPPASPSETQPSPPSATPSSSSAATSQSKPKPGFGTSTSTLAAEQDKQPLPWLSRPLGVPIKPSKYASPPRSRKERAEEYLASGRLKEREAIIKNATQGYFHDFHASRSHGGKTWRAPGTMIRQDKALYFPKIEGTCLEDKSAKNTVELCEGKVSVVCLLSTKISEEHCKSFYEPTLSLYSSHPRFQLLQLNIQPNLLKHYLISLFLSSLRSQIPQPLHRSYLLSKLDLDSSNYSGGRIHREDLGVANKHVGYVYLVGPDGKIRWAGGGFAEKGERDALLSCAGVLLGRAD